MLANTAAKQPKQHMQFSAALHQARWAETVNKPCRAPQHTAAHPLPAPAPALQLLEERDAELERMDSVMGGLREAAATREAALQEARRSLGDVQAALREKEARWGIGSRVEAAGWVGVGRLGHLGRQGCWLAGWQEGTASLCS